MTLNYYCLHILVIFKHTIHILCDGNNICFSSDELPSQLTILQPVLNTSSTGSNYGQLLLLEFPLLTTSHLKTIYRATLNKTDNFKLLSTFLFDICVLRSVCISFLNLSNFWWFKNLTVAVGHFVLLRQAKL